jgi:predicted DNA-binding transcriptional regulator AlpA
MVRYKELGQREPERKEDNDMEERLLSLKNVMDIFSIKRTTVTRWIQKGHLVQIKLPCTAKVYITENSVKKLISNGVRSDL